MLRFLPSILLLLAFSASSAAQATKPPMRMAGMQATGFPNYCGGSIECIISQSPDVIRATILTVENDNLTVHIRETIKGSLTPDTTLAVSAGGWPFAAGQDVVLPLVDVKGAGKGARSSFRSRPLILDGMLPYYTMDLRPHTDPRDVMAAVREVAAQQIDPNLRQISLMSGGKMLVVPAAPKLEAIAQQWATERPVYARLLAIQALEPFKSEQNIAILTSLLADTRSAPPLPRSSVVRVGGKWQEGEYDIRYAAWKLLRQWKAQPPSLPMEGPIFSYTDVKTPTMRYLIAGGAVMLALIAWSYLRRSAMVLRVASCIVMIAVIAALSVLWTRSRSTVDEIMFAAGSSHHEIASYSGGIHYQVMRQWDGPRQLVYGSFDRASSDDVWSIDNQSPAKRRSKVGFCYASGIGNGPQGSVHPFGLFRIPFWAPMALAFIPLALNTLALTRQLRRRRLGLCRHCGYDLRETTSGVCPECGKEVTRKRSALLKAGNEVPVGGQAVGM